MIILFSAEKVTLFVGNLAEGLKDKDLTKFFKKRDIATTEVRRHQTKPYVSLYC